MSKDYLNKKIGEDNNEEQKNLFGYTDEDNPFGDDNLSKTFVWKKKFEKLGISKVDEEQVQKYNMKKFEETKRELEKVKQRRLEREKEREERLKDLERQQREKEAQQFEEWEKQEDTFHLKQAKLRCALRIKEGRAKPIDLLARYVDAFADKKEDEEVEELPFKLVEPYLCLNGLRISDLEDLQEDIRIYMKIDSELNIDFWKDIKIIVDDELNKLKKFTSANSVERREGINPAVANEVISIFDEKTPQQLQALQKEIEKKISSKQVGLDISYWESLLSKLKAHLARARLKELHKKNLNKNLNIIKKEIKNDVIESEETIAGPSTNVDNKSKSFYLKQNIEDREALLKKCIEDYEEGRYSPKLITNPDTRFKIIDPEDDWNQLIMQRKFIIKSSNNKDRKIIMKSFDELRFEREARKGMNEEERVFANEVAISQSSSFLSWADKYKPRKPRYFNRVHTGFEWNKYNQTHYDVDNPPPKIVQGYKFNIFYPDLIDKNTTPTYKFENCPESKDFKIIRFVAGPPYEDIAFKIVNREWNNSYKSGFRNQFNNNILQLWFHFKRYRYRR